MTRRVFALSVLLLAAAGTTTSAFGYARNIHRKIADHAFDQAAGESDFLQRYGWADVPDVLKMSFRYGADHQDDWGRSLHHFYDPQARTGLKVKVPPLPIGVCLPFGMAAPEWAEDPANAHGIVRAREQFFRVLTETSAGDGMYARFELFEDLGHVAHLIQDMAQPEHTRNDQHLMAIDATAPSLYEHWTRDHLSAHWLPDGTPTAGFFQGHPGPAASMLLRSYFDGSHGLALYSSLNHVTQDTNYHDAVWCAAHPQPTRHEGSARFETTTFPVVDPATGIVTPTAVVEKVYSRTMYDGAAQNWDVDSYHTILSAIDHEANRYGKRVFSLSDASWQSRAKNLVPKAVGYSASMIKGFFNGRVMSRWGITDAGTIRITMDTLNGVPYFEDATVRAYRQDDAGNLVELAPPKVLPVATFGALVAEIPNTPDPIYKNGLRVVVRGRLSGQPDMVAAHIIRPRHEMKLVVEYDNAFTYQRTAMQITAQSTIDSCGGCNTIGQWPPPPPPFNPVGRGIPLSDMNPPPFNGRIEFKVGAADDQRFVGSLSLTGASQPSTSKTATLTLYRNGAVVAQRQIPYTSNLSSQFDFDGAGTFTLR